MRLGRGRGMITNAHITVDSSSYEKVIFFNIMVFIGKSKFYSRGNKVYIKKQGIRVIIHQNTFMFSLKIWKLEYINGNIASYALWLWNIVSYITEGTQVNTIWKQDPEAYIWAQKGWEWGVKILTMRNFKVRTTQLL